MTEAQGFLLIWYISFAVLGLLCGGAAAATIDAAAGLFWWAGWIVFGAMVGLIVGAIVQWLG